MKDRTTSVRGSGRTVLSKKEIRLSSTRNMYSMCRNLILQAVEEAICFGCFDGQVKTIESDNYMSGILPRKAKSPGHKSQITGRRMIM